MIVGTCFDGDGDVDTRIQWLQHDVYSEALGIISRTCQEHMRTAHAMLDYWDGWEFIERFDHRTLQHAHDLLAAVWRFRYETKHRQYELPFEEQKPLFEGPRGDKPDFAGRWLTWLQEQVDSWIHDPERVLLVVTILRNQNQPAGYKAETALHWNIMMGCSDVPWKRSVIHATKSALKAE